VKPLSDGQPPGGGAEALPFPKEGPHGRNDQTWLAP